MADQPERLTTEQLETLHTWISRNGLVSLPKNAGEEIWRALAELIDARYIIGLASQHRDELDARILQLEAEAAEYREVLEKVWAHKRVLTNDDCLRAWEMNKAVRLALAGSCEIARQALQSPSPTSDSIKRVLEAVKKWCERDEVYGSKISISLAKDDLDAAWEAYLSPSPEKSVYND